MSGMFSRMFGKNDSQPPPTVPAPRQFSKLDILQDVIFIDNDLASEKVQLKIYPGNCASAFSAVPFSLPSKATVNAGQTLRFLPRVTVGGGAFDCAVWFSATVSGKDITANSLCVAGNRYRLFLKPSVSNSDTETTETSHTLSIELISRRVWPKSDLLAKDIPNLSFGFSASGWLLVYQFGVAACLQDNGITKNTTVHVAGASGGAITSVLMMCGCDVRNVLLQAILEAGENVHDDIRHAIKLREYLVKAMEKVFTDDSWRCQPLVRGQVHVSISETREGKASLGAQQKRISNFGSTRDLAICVLASSSMGISGLPIKLPTGRETDKNVYLGDGGLTDFVPSINENTITIKPMSDFGLIEGYATIQPSETVPPLWGVYPAPSHMIEHLFELGYRDMRKWLFEENGENKSCFEKHVENLQNVSNESKEMVDTNDNQHLSFLSTKVDISEARLSTSVMGVQAVSNSTTEQMTWLKDVHETVNVTVEQEVAEIQLMINASKESMIRRGQELDDAMTKICDESGAYANKELWKQGICENMEMVQKRFQNDFPESYSFVQDNVGRMKSSIQNLSNTIDNKFKNLFSK